MSESHSNKKDDRRSPLGKVEIALRKAREQHRLVLLGEGDVHTARAPAYGWDSLKEFQIASQLARQNRIVTLGRTDPANTAFDILRTKLLQTLRQNNWSTVAITSPTPACGKTFVAVNLAISLARHQDLRTVLVDLDLRQPKVSSMLGLSYAPSIEPFLNGQAELSEAFLRYGNNLAFAPNNVPVRLATELIQTEQTRQSLTRMRQTLKPNVVIFDMPPMLSTDDTLAFMPHVDCAILVVAAGATTPNEADICEQELSTRTNVLGVVLNKSSLTTEAYGY